MRFYDNKRSRSLKSYTSLCSDNGVAYVTSRRFRISTPFDEVRESIPRDPFFAVKRSGFAFIETDFYTFRLISLTCEGYATSGKIPDDFNVSTPPTLVPHKPWLMEYFDFSHEKSNPLFFR